MYTVIAVGLIVGLPANYYLDHYILLNEGDYFNLKINGFYQTVAYSLGVVPLAMTYVAFFMLAFQTAF